MPFVESIRKGNFCFRAYITELKIFKNRIPCKQLLHSLALRPRLYDKQHWPHSNAWKCILPILFEPLTKKKKKGIVIILFFFFPIQTKTRILSRQKVEAQFKPANPKSLHITLYIAYPFNSFKCYFNSLFKVLFIFPSRYLFAIGLLSVFSLGWMLTTQLRLQSQTTRLYDCVLITWDKSPRS